MWPVRLLPSPWESLSSPPSYSVLYFASHAAPISSPSSSLSFSQLDGASPFHVHPCE